MIRAFPCRGNTAYQEDDFTRNGSRNRIGGAHPTWNVTVGCEMIK